MRTALSEEDASGRFCGRCGCFLACPGASRTRLVRLHSSSSSSSSSSSGGGTSRGAGGGGGGSGIKGRSRRVREARRGCKNLLVSGRPECVYNIYIYMDR
jgi:hypothetical protein